MGAMAWAIQTGRKVIMQVEGEPAYKLPDHHNDYGEAWWIDQDVPKDKTKCIFSADSSFEPEEKKEDWGVWENITMLSVKEEKP